MNTQRKRKVALAALLVAASFTVSSCYMNREDITGGSNLPLGGSNGLPFATLGVTPTPTLAPTPTPTVAGVNQFQFPDGWGSTNPPTATPSQNYVNPTSPPVPTSPPSTKTTPPQQDDSVLKSGSTGDAVKQLQQKLKQLGYYTGTVDGAYGSGTTNAVKDFQQVNGLSPIDGIAGKKTQDALYSYYAIAKSKGSGTATTPRNTATPRPTTVSVPSFGSNTFLRLGSSGNIVKQTQARLISLGYLGGTADGDFGEATETALKAFQKRAGEWTDGVAGEKTLTKLFASNAPRANSMASTVGMSLKEGMDGDEVRALQRRLIELGYLKGTADGDFGAGTKAAVIAFQQRNGLTADGIAGTATQNKLYAADVVKSDGTGSTATATPSSGSGYATLREGDSGDAVKRLQQKLKELGYYNGTVDGAYGAGTVKAVTSFQAVNKLTADGVAGPATQQRLFGDSSTSNKVPGSLKLYDEGTNVRDTQYALYELGYYQDAVNGIYGDSTQSAVREFQMINGLKVDGVAGNATLNLLFSSAAKPVASVSGEFVTLQRGSEGDEVVQLQATLVDLGYLDGNVTGVFDDATFAALKSFQQYNGLTVDGIAGSTTQEKLYSDAAVANPLRH